MSRAAQPKWVKDLLVRGREDGKWIDPWVKWRKGSSVWSSGHCYSGYIVVTAGTDRRDQREVLLHELAHWTSPGFHHDDRFYRTLFDLVKWDGRLTMKYVLGREGRYKAQAIKTAKAMGIRGAGTIGKETRKARAWRYNRQPRGWCPVELPKCHFSRTPHKRHTHYLGQGFSQHEDGEWKHYTVTEPVRAPWAKEVAA